VSAQAAPSATVGAARRVCRSTDSGDTIRRGWGLEPAASWLKQVAAAGLLVVLIGCPIFATEDALPASAPAMQSVPSTEGPAIEWQRTISLGGGTYGVGVGIVRDGGFVLLAQAVAEDQSWLIRLNAAGEILWQKILSDRATVAYSLDAAEDGSVFVVGTAEADDVTRAWMIKLDPMGKPIWEHTYAGHGVNMYGEDVETDRCAYAGQGTSDGGYVVVGETGGRVWLLKLDPSGNAEWERVFGDGGGRKWGLSCAQAADGGYVIAALNFTHNPGRTDEDIWLIRTDAHGEVLWDRLFGGDETEGPPHIAKTADGGYVVVALTDRDPRVADHDLWVFKISGDGGEIWSVRFDRAHEIETTWISEASDGGYLVCASYVGDRNSSWLWLMLLSPAGEAEWSRILEVESSGVCIQPTTDGGCVALGTGEGGSSGEDMHLVKLAPYQVKDGEVPVADAGADQRLVDSDGDGRETVAFDGSSSFDEDGQIVAYVWSEKGKEFARGQRASADFVTGEHTIELTVTDSDGLTATTETIVAITPPQDLLAMHLRGHGSVDPVLDVEVGQLFDIELETDGAEPTQVRFLIDSQNDDQPYGEWSSWCEWGDSAEGWDASSKRRAWSCPSSGQNEIWAEARYADARFVQTSARVLVASVGEPPACAGLPPAVLWEAAYDGGAPGDIMLDEVSMADGGFALLCSYGMDWLPRVVRTDKTGAVVWEARFSDVLTRNALAATDDGGVLTVGSGPSGDAETRGLSVQKLSADGETEWERTYSGEGGTGFAGIGAENCADAGYLVIAARPGSLLILKVDSQGAVDWQSRQDLWSDNVWRTLSSCGPTPAGGFMLAGVSHPTDWSAPSVWVLELGPMGNLESEYSLPADSRDRRSWIQVLPTREVLLARGVTTQMGGERFELQITKLDRFGNGVWEKTYLEEEPFSEAEGASDVHACIRPTQDGGFVSVFQVWFYRHQGSQDVGPPQTARVCVVRAITSSGDCTWEVRDRSVHRVLAPESGGYALMGFTENHDPCIIRLAAGQRVPPVVNAGLDQTIIDSDGNGEDVLTLDGRGSSVSDGRIASYVWTEAGRELGRGETLRVALAVGIHEITLTAVDDKGLASSDSVRIEIRTAAASCSVELRDEKVAAPIEVIRAVDSFNISVGVSGSPIDRVRFSSDDAADGIPAGEWTQWYDWTSSLGAWDSADKMTKWAFATPGQKEVWAEVAGTNVVSRCSARISVVAELSFWAEVANAPEGRWSIRRSAGLSSEGDVLKRVPNGWVLRVTDTHADAEMKDGYIWWEVEDTTEGLTGWMAAANEKRSTTYLVADAQGDSSQETLRQKADRSFADTREERVGILKAAVEHFFADSSTQPSLYSSDDRARDGTPNDISLLRREGFPIEVVLAIIVQESGGAKEPYDNSGLGSMQITDRNLKGLSSGIQCDDEEGSKFYGNTPQAIYANVKDGLKTLRDNFHRRRHMQSRLGFAVLEYNIGGDPNTGFCYMCWGDPFYLAHIGMRLDGDDQCEGGACAKLLFRRPACNPQSLACGVSTNPTVKELGAELQPTLAGQLKGYQTNYVMAFTCSPATVRIRDAAGRVTGLLGGRVVEDVPDCAYIGGAVMSLSPEDSFVYEVVGQSEGAYDLVVDHVVAGRQATVEAAGVPTSPGAVHRYLVDWNALAAGKSGVTLMVDEDGDGEYERSLEAGARLDGADLQMRSPSQVTEHGSGTWLYAAIGLALGGGLAALGILALRGRRSRR